MNHYPLLVVGSPSLLLIESYLILILARSKLFTALIMQGMLLSHSASITGRCKTCHILGMVEISPESRGSLFFQSNSNLERGSCRPSTASKNMHVRTQ